MFARAILSAAAVATFAAGQGASPSPQPFPCSFNSTKNANSMCPSLGQPCSTNLLCGRGLYCKANAVGEGGKSFTGVCSTGPDITEVYGKPCTLGRDVPECVYNNPLALSPRAAPSALTCMRAFETDTAGTCRIGPNKHGDACNQNGECASDNCLRELKICKGIDEGEVCEPSFPDPCEPDHYCRPEAGGFVGRCSKVSNSGKQCESSESCQRGYYCAGPTPTGSKKCIAPFTVPDYTNTTVGAWMCHTANAVMVAKGANDVDSVYQCRPINETSLVNKPCNPRLSPPLGYECACAGAAGGFRLRTIGGLGLGVRVTAWHDLFKCLVGASGLMGELCEFDSVDLTHVRYGSCAYYACYPQYLRLVNATGSIVFNPPMSQFENFANCELDAAKTYYGAVATTECLSLPNMQNWKCAVDEAAASLSVANTSGVIAFIFLVFLFGYVGHMYAFRKETETHLPCVRD